MSTKKSNFKKSCKKAKNLNKIIISYHLDMNIDAVVLAMLNMFITIINFVSQFRMEKDTVKGNPNMQNIQKLTANDNFIFLCVQIFSVMRARVDDSSLLMFESINVDEQLREYYPKI